MIVSEENKLSENKMDFDQRQKELEKQKKKEEKEQKDSPFKKFYQINKEQNKELIALAGKNPQALRILLFIFEHMDKYNALICSYTVFQEALGISQATVARAVKLLKEKNFIVVKKSGTANVYIASDNLVWNSWGKNKNYCQFPSNVIITMSEQEGNTTKVKEKRTKSVELKE